MVGDRLHDKQISEWSEWAGGGSRPSINDIYGLLAAVWFERVSALNGMYSLVSQW